MILIIVMSVAVFAFCITAICLQGVGRKIDIKRSRLESVVLEEKTDVSELDLSLYRRFMVDKVEDLKKSLEKLIVLKKKNKKPTGNSKLQRNLKMAGIYMDPDEYNVVRMTVTFSLVTFGIILSTILKADVLLKMLVILVFVILSVLAPNYFLKARISARERSIRTQLPEVMDLLSVSMEAGLGFDAAILKITEKLSGPLIDSIRILYREIQMGKSRREALKNFANRSDVAELKTFASALISANALGISVKNVLGVLSEQLRVERRQAAQEKGMKAPVKMMLPMVVFIFPIIFIILLGPTVIQLMKQFK
ncbi:MAG: type II secretion system F family protein [Eubacteriales bacterium]|nr:type II secretion system F family protein [Eubacteriales bacterium]